MACCAGVAKLLRAGAGGGGAHPASRALPTLQIGLLAEKAQQPGDAEPSSRARPQLAFLKKNQDIQGAEWIKADTPTSTMEPITPISPGSMTPMTRELRLATSHPGKALAERLKDVSARAGNRPAIRLQEVRGTTGCAHEGFLTEVPESLSCCVAGRKDQCFLAVKGPWILKFRSDSAQAKSVGVPMPLDGATVTPIGTREFEIGNVHIKKDFYGKEALQVIPGFSKESFAHAVHRSFVAPSTKARDEWVQVLQTQVAKLADKLALKLHSPRSPRKQQRQWTVDTIMEVNTLASALFAQYEEEEEVAELEAAYGVQLRQRSKGAKREQ